VKLKKMNEITAQRNNRIIVIDDDPEIWEAYRAILLPNLVGEQFKAGKKIGEMFAEAAELSPTEKVEFDLTFASQGREGYQLVEKATQEGTPYAIAFVDVRMPPGWDGLETAAKIRAIDPDIEIVIVTAYADRSRDEIALAVKPPHKLLYLRKPFDLDELKQIALSLSEKWNITQLELQQRENMAAILRTTPAAIFTTDEKRRITSWNKAAEQITGYSAEEVLGRMCIFHEISKDNVCRECEAGKVVPQNKPNLEINFEDKTGKLKSISMTLSPLKNKKGENIGIVESFWDITSRKEAEEALHESEERFRSLVETTSDWVWEIDSEGRFTYCSPVCEKIYGYKPEELLGRGLLESLVAPESTEEFSQRLKQCLNDACGFSGIERQALRKDGTGIYIESSATPVLGENGTVVSFHGIDRDITKRKRLELEKFQLEERNHQAHKLEALGTLAGGIAHDFNNILTPIIGYAQLGELNLEKNDLEKAKESFQIIKNSANSASEMTRQILAFSRQQVLDIRKINLSDTIHTMSKMLHRLIREDIELVFDLADDILPIKADTGRLGQILMNLLVNAKDAITASGIITISTKNVTIPDDAPLVDAEKNSFSGPFTLLEVSDNGAGIDKENLERIFDPFFTTKPMGAGTGIGLSTVFGIVKQHGGHILLESEIGQGTKVRIYFRTVEKERTLPESLQNAAGIKKGNETLLVVEDNREVLAAISAGLKIFGYTVLEASGSDKAIRMIHDCDEKIDMLITDVVMPGLSGKAVAETFRIKFDDLPILFISGYSSEVNPKDLEFIKGSYFLQKPFSPSQIAAKIRAILDGEEEALHEISVKEA
jgi:two-component system, cell cycle sensor histidine kinase and response regulator CckA